MDEDLKKRLDDAFAKGVLLGIKQSLIAVCVATVIAIIYMIVW